MIYKDPSTIFSPQDSISDVTVLYEDPESVSIAKIKWDNKDVIGIRWNISKREWNDPQKINGTKECLGMPVSRGFPTWFILPQEITNLNSDLNKILQKINAEE